MSARRQTPWFGPRPKAKDVVELIDGPVLSSIEYARYGEMKPLADRIRGKSATVEERAAAGDILEDLETMHSSQTAVQDRKRKFTFGRLARTRAYETLKYRAIVAYVLALEKRGWPRKVALPAAVAEFDRKRSQIYKQKAFQKYEDDPECRTGVLTTPWASACFLTVLSPR
jgi:hypothetical protein